MRLQVSHSADTEDQSGTLTQSEKKTGTATCSFDGTGNGSSTGTRERGAESAARRALGRREERSNYGRNERRCIRSQSQICSIKAHDEELVNVHAWEAVREMRAGAVRAAPCRASDASTRAIRQFTCTRSPASWESWLLSRCWRRGRVGLKAEDKRWCQFSGVESR